MCLLPIREAWQAHLSVSFGEKSPLIFPICALESTVLIYLLRYRFGFVDAYRKDASNADSSIKADG